MKSLSKAESLIVGEFKVFEMTSPAVDGTKPFISGPLYTDLIEENLSTSIRIAREIKLKVQKEHLNKIAL